ncbi:MAG: aminomethyl-transferring glycine dehydrogenase [Flavobacteriales bacterium]|jgi:glycine dehydrogenase|uniref:aminomethyl-transferring glycine dehydrogenase n=1 Tax=Blattabacterium sp. (Mastotermes darwiniensis) TaxID=39768 RepID=UPI000231DF43|nr:aminomethyl-transferring glycine dehydrogenase [Blattabacterium sp. (Mastotermes darwiniensis)]AER40352.1 glycine cleavage system protein P [Blattabacterium sp. (Mastotermes darwiniensis) str. MADAR]MDR1804927.1 aminomethyl-transferring glycine dehydrogenase [Flavobacteriales bacterium]
MNENFFRKKFYSRHIGPSCEEIYEMLKILQCKSIKDLINKTIPKEIRLRERLKLPNSISEYQYLSHIYKISNRNKIYRTYIGLGYKNTITPAVIQRNILENPSWYTPYTPYQSEISQGRLEALINFQTMISDLTGMKISNASMLDEGSSTADAMLMVYKESLKKRRITKKSPYFFVSNEIFPQTLSIIKTRCYGLGINLIEDFHENLKKYKKKEIFGLLLPYPSSSGEIYDYRETVLYAKKKEISVIVSTDLLFLTLLKPPGEFQADVVVGSTQSFGIPMGYGGPHAAFFSTHERYKRFIPGRIIGESIDRKKKKAFRLSLQTREQHIKREKATSNICTSQVLPAIMASMYALYHGPKGLRFIAETIHKYTQKLEFLLVNTIDGIDQMNLFYFDTLRIKIKNHKIFSLEKLKRVSERKKTNFRYIDKNHLTITLDETTLEEDIHHIVSIFREVGLSKKDTEKKFFNNKYKIQNSLKRTSNFLEHPIFHKFHSENELMRYIKRLERKDLSLNHSMIPLGSCTMKLNASSELFSLSQYEWRNIHPFSPKDQTKGYQLVIQKLENYLKEITGFSGVSLQPNSGAQGEYAGLMVIKYYHHFLQEDKRNIALIPSSSHGTNPASAMIAGMKVVLILTKKDGSIDKNDLLKKVKENKDFLSVLMITYPSTHGVYESNIKEIIDIIHEHGGLVYMDGANMNAQIGLMKPAKIGIDVCHINLHKTFAIPHGGGGPGMGPICVAKHLKPFLPNHPFLQKKETDKRTTLTISSSPYGSPLILTISYAYIRMLGPNGLKKCTEISILNANYIKEKLKNYYKILFVGKNDTVAHELIIDCRMFKSIGIEIMDIAKRMMDYGYHAPTISFPVEGCMMIEPTESESKEELDRFIETLINIRKEIDEIEKGLFSSKENVLKNAPHSLSSLTEDNWMYPYTREKAAYPLPWVRERKFWPSIDRIDDGYGDRNFICTCT